MPLYAAFCIIVWVNKTCGVSKKDEEICIELEYVMMKRNSVQS